MKRERILMIGLAVTVALSLITVSLVTAEALANADDPANPPPKKEDVPTEVFNGGAAIIVTKTVGVAPNNCATTQTIIVTPGTEVVYCYKVENTGDVTLTLHNLVDSELGVILNGTSFPFFPDSTAVLTRAAVIDTSTINVFTWTAYNPGPTDSVSALDAATVIADEFGSCRSPNLSIPDNYPTGTIDVMNVTDSGRVVDLDVYLEVNHTWVGDLKFNLEHEASGITTTLIDRIGLTPLTPLGCSYDDIRAIIDDEAEQDIETTCNFPLAAAGHFVGGDPANNNLLTAFDGQPFMGAWQLQASDRSVSDIGMINRWCLLPTLAAISVNPSELNVTQPSGQQTTLILELHNNDTQALDWSIYEPLENSTDNNRPLQGGSMTVLYDNGLLLTLAGGGADGADVSIVQESLGLSTLGFGLQAESNRSIADDFTITDPYGWYIDEITFFAYQTNSPLTSTITAVNYRIWDGPPNDPTSHIVLGNPFTNSLIETAWSGMYRVLESSLTATDRPIMQNRTKAGFTLGPGTYWLEWQAEGILASGPWSPPVTISGVLTTGNALQYLNSEWGPAIDTSAAAQQDLPFIISGQVLTDIPWVAASPTSGTLPPGTRQVMVTFDSTGLGLGVYTGKFVVASKDPDIAPVTVPLRLTVNIGHTYVPTLLTPTELKE